MYYFRNEILCKILFCERCNLYEISFCYDVLVFVCSKSKQSPDGGEGFLMYWLHAANVGKGRKKEEQVQAK